MNQFPLSDPNKYVRKHDHINGIADEEPYRLLLNPCIDNPEEHLEYGTEGVIRPKRIQRVGKALWRKRPSMFMSYKGYLLSNLEKEC